MPVVVRKPVVETSPTQTVSLASRCALFVNIFLEYTYLEYSVYQHPGGGLVAEMH